MFKIYLIVLTYGHSLSSAVLSTNFLRAWSISHWNQQKDQWTSAELDEAKFSTSEALQLPETPWQLLLMPCLVYKLFK